MEAKKILIGVALVAGGYVLGLSTPTASAYTGNELQIQNKIVSELSGIRRALDVIGRNTK